MNLKESLYFKVVQTLGTINICGTTMFGVKSADYGITITKLDLNYEYGMHIYYQVEFCRNGNKQDIELNGALFSSILHGIVTKLKEVMDILP